MGFQDGIIQLKGRVGNVTFYKTKDGYVARTAKGLDGNKVKNHPAFARTRENMAEFQQVMKGIRLFHAAFADDIKTIAESGMTRKLTSLFSKLLRQDTINARGERRMMPATVAALEGLQFNPAARQNLELKLPFVTTLDRQTGNLTVDVAAFSPRQVIARPDSATHFILKATAVELDFTLQKFVSKFAESPPIAVDAQQHDALSLASSIPGSTAPLLLAFGIRFIHVINGFSYPLKTAELSSMQIVKVDTGVTV